MARSSRTPERRSRRWLYAGIILAVVLVAGVYVLVAAPPPPPARPVVDFVFALSIQYHTQGGFRFLIPPAIGVPGGIWASHQYDSYGLNSRYPVYTEGPPNPYPGYSIIHVRTTAAHPFTLGDFFAVYGQTLGRNDTLGITAVPNGSFWDMCVGSPPAIRAGYWAAEVLADRQNITLVYGTTCV